MQKRWIWPFELEEQLGAGGMGVVYKARFVKNDRRVALKLLPDEVAANETLAARFDRELEILKDLRHPNIVHCFGGTCEGSQRFYAMELVEGGTVESLLKEHRRLPWERVVEYALQVCSALAYAHAQGIIHRDIKPANLLLTKAGKVKLGDFGLASVVTGTKLTSAGRTLGTLHYMAPEQIRGTPPLSNRTDLYALGCSMFEMLTGETPFNGETAAEILNRHLEQNPPRVSALALDCPPELDKIVVDLMQKDPARRPEDASAVIRLLQSVGQTVRLGAPTDRMRFDAAPTREVASVSAAAATEAPPLTRRSDATTPRQALVAAVLLLLLFYIDWKLPSFEDRAAYSRAEAQWLAALRDAHPSVRVFAARALGEIGPAAKAAIPELTASLNDPDPIVRKEAASALGKFGREAMPAMAAIHRVQKIDDNPQVRVAAEQALVQIRAAGSGRSFLFYGGLAICAALVGGGFWIWRHWPAGGWLGLDQREAPAG